MKGTVMFAAGWAVAAAAGAWWASLGGAEQGGGAAERPERSRRAAAVVQTAGVPHAAKAAAAAGNARGDGDAGKAAAGRAKGWRPEDKWNVPALYGILGNVPPEVRAVADRIRDAHGKAMKGGDVSAIFACVADARECPNPIVRAMMVDALRLCAMKAKGMRFAGATDEEVKRRRDDAAVAAFEAAKAFAADPNKFVARNASNTMFHGLKGIADSALRYSLLEDAVVATGGMICGEIKPLFNGDSMPLTTSMGATGLEGRNACILSLVRGMEKLGDGEGRRLAEKLFKDETGEEYVGVGDYEELASWLDGLKDAGKQLFGTDRKGEEFAALVEMGSREDKEKYSDLGEAIESASGEFSNPSIAMMSVEQEERLKKASVELYGDTDKAREWFQEELAFHKGQMKKIDEALNKMRMRWENAVKTKQAAKEKEGK